MRTILRFVLPFVVLIAAGACAPSRPLLSEQMLSDLSSLREECRTSGLTFTEVAKADSLFDTATKLKARGHQREAYHFYDYAMILYRLALVKKELVLSAERTKELEATLNAATSKLQTYEKTLNELKAERQP
jgi:chromosome segregation ATPase